MKKFLFILFLFTSLFVISCSSPSTQEPEKEPPVLSTAEKNAQELNWDKDNISHLYNFSEFTTRYTSKERLKFYSESCNPQTSNGSGLVGYTEKLYKTSVYYTTYKATGEWKCIGGFDTGSMMTDWGYFLLRKAPDGRFLMKTVDILGGAFNVEYYEYYVSESGLRYKNIPASEFEPLI